MTIKTLVELVQDIEDGKEIELACSLKNTWNAINIVSYSFGQLSDWIDDGRIRIKPEEKIIDLSVLIDSGIDCEFTDNLDTGWFHIGKLKAIHDVTTTPEGLRFKFTYDRFSKKGGKKYGFINSDESVTLYQDSIGSVWKYCRPRMNHIHHWKNGDCPLPEGLVLSLYHRDGSVSTDVTFYLSAGTGWNGGKGGLPDIIGFEVLGVSGGWIYPWESE